MYIYMYSCDTSVQVISSQGELLSLQRLQCDWTSEKYCSFLQGISHCESLQVLQQQEACHQQVALFDGLIDDISTVEKLY